MQIEIGAELRRDGIEKGRSPAILFRQTVGVGEDEVLGDLAQRVVAGEGGKTRLLLGGGKREVRGEEQRACQEGRQVLGEARIARARDQPAPQDDVGLEELHHDELQGLVEMQDLGNEARRQLRLAPQGKVLVMGARQRQRPALPDEAHEGKRLFHRDAAMGAFDDEDEVQIAVTDLAHRPGCALLAETLARGRNAGEIAGKIGLR